MLRDDHDRPTGDVDVAAVAEDLEEPRPQLELPEQLRNAAVYDALTVSVLGRQDLIRLKMYAATDEGPASQHARDLATMHATHDERAEALAWVRHNTNQDPQLIDDLAIHFGMGT